MYTLLHGGEVYSTEEKKFIKNDILLKDGLISDIFSAESRNLPTECEHADCRGKYIIPGLVDVHTHGRSGVDFNNITEETLPKVRRDYAKSGTTTIMGTLASAEYDSLLSSIDILVKNRTPEKGMANIAGVHLEGRYLNPVKRGAHAEHLLHSLDSSEIRELVTRMCPSPAHVSCAAEMEGGEEFVKTAISLGATVGLAHSNATYDEAMKAVSWGIRSFTHTFNAMRNIHHREPGNAIASVLCDSAYTEIICDGEHIHPSMVSLAARLKPDDKFVLITDSMEATGCPDGEYSIAGLPVLVKNGRAVNSDNALAGSTLTMFKALCNFMKFTEKTLEESIPAATSNPAAMVGISDKCGKIKKGLRGDLLILDGKTEPNIESVFVNGEKI